MASPWHGGCFRRICLAAALAGSAGLALYYGYKLYKQSPPTKEIEEEKEEKESHTKIESDTTTEDTKENTNAKYLSEPLIPVPTTEHIDTVQNILDPFESSLTESSFSILADATSLDEKNERDEIINEEENKNNKEESTARNSTLEEILDTDKTDKNEKAELTTKDDNDIVVIQDKKNEKVIIEEGVVISESASLASSVPPPLNDPPSLSAFDLSSLESEPDKDKRTGSEQPLSLSSYEIPSLEPDCPSLEPDSPCLEPDKSKSDNGSDIEILNNDNKSVPSTPEPKPAPSQKSEDSKPADDSKKSEVSAASTDAETIVAAASIAPAAEAEPEKSEPEAPKRGKRAKGRHRKSKDEPDAATKKLVEQIKEEIKDTDKPAVPKPKPATRDKPEIEISKDHEVHVKHPTNHGEFLSFGMRLKSHDSSTGHAITNVEDGGPASEVGLKNGDQILRVNDMNVSHWSRAILLEQFRMIPSDQFDLKIKRDNQGKEFKVHIKKEPDGVAVSGEVIDVTNDQKPQDISLEAVQGDEAVHKCFIAAHTGDCAQITGEGLTMKQKDDTDLSFRFEKVHFKTANGTNSVLVLKGSRKGAPVYITVLNRSTIGVQCGAGEDVCDLKTADPRCFYIKESEGGSCCLESTQFSDHYLCCEDDHLVLLYVTEDTELKSNKNIQFTFDLIKE